MSGVRRALLRRVDHVWELGWFNLVGVVLVGFFLFLASMPLSAGVDHLRAEKSGVGGTVSLSRCAVNEWARGDPWQCEGNFVSADGAVRIARVAYQEDFDEDPRTAGKPLVVDARVRGAEASRAWPPGDEWQTGLIVGIFCLVLTAMILWWWVSPGDERPAPTQPSGRRRPRSAKPPARARMRRRRR
ncbi:hypothetical protein [Micromonospora sp. NPDC051006]|uniref:hypothetical protein n=1 Tax=Micromonospora sp. NPDC051006 TaxID=3364283 RepID=UPI00379171E0